LGTDRSVDEAAVREVLEAERAAALALVRAMTSEFDGIVAESVNSNTDDEHDPEGSTIAYERARVTALLAVAQANVDALDRALARLAAGCYLKCEGCHLQISPERLEARPAARLCFDCANSRRY
jgi:DnaK suppressor protein